MKTFPPVVLAALALSATARLSAGEIDRQALYKHMRSVNSWPAGVELELKEVKPSPIAGFLEGTVEGRYKGNTKPFPILVAEDGKWYLLGRSFELVPSKIPGLSTSPDPDAPAVLIGQDLKHFTVGQIYDLTIDPDEANSAKIKIEGFPFKGKAKAPLTFVEYSDLECPYCARAHKFLEAELLKSYPDKVRWVFKNLPLTNIHPWAYNAAIAYACASKQKPEGGFQFQGMVFEAQESLNPGNFREKALEFAGKAGLKADAFTACIDKQETKEAVEADIREFKSLGFDMSTPTFFINGRHAQASDFGDLRPLLEEKLAEKADKKKKT